MRDNFTLDKISSRVVGLKQTLSSIINDTARCVLVSYDCDDFIITAVNDAVLDKNVEIIRDFSKKELGKKCGIKVSASVVAILK